ncbi:hypothetical protein D3C81_1783270 [compost metagenome]
MIKPLLYIILLTFRKIRRLSKKKKSESSTNTGTFRNDWMNKPAFRSELTALLTPCQ